MIQKVLNSIKGVFIPKSEFEESETQTSLLKKKAEHFKVECAIDNKVVPCSELKTTPYIGVPAPAYLVDDPWFGPAPMYTDKQKDYMAIETEHKQQEQKSSSSVESEDIHEMMYQIATQTSSPTTLQLDPPGGSENFHEGPGGWQSGNGYNQFRKD